MNTVEKKLDFQVELWTFLGLAVALATAILLVAKGVTATLYFSWILLVGSCLCWKWKLRGLWTSVSLVAGLMAYSYLDIAPADRLWYVGMALSMMLTFVVLTFCYQEVKEVLDAAETESSSRLKSLVQLDTKMESLRSEQRAYVSKFIEQENKLQLYQKQNEALRQEVADAQQRLQQQQEEAMSPDAAARRWAGMYHQLRQQFEEKSSLLDATRRTLFLTEEKVLHVEQQEKQRELDMTEMERGLQCCLIEVESENERLKSEIQALEELLSHAS